jgi:hypothetical protein
MTNIYTGSLGSIVISSSLRIKYPITIDPILWHIPKVLTPSATAGIGSILVLIRGLPITVVDCYFSVSEGVCGAL